MSNKEDALKKSMIAFEKAKRRMEEAQKAYREEVDAIILKPVQARNITREQAVKLAKVIESDETFMLLLEMSPHYSKKEREGNFYEEEND